jgi:protein TonB
MKNTSLAKVSINAIKNGPKWIPAQQNGHTVASYRLQPVTLTNPEKPNQTSGSDKPGSGLNDDRKIFVRVEQSASFPGGQTAWLKYLSRVFDKNGNELMSDKNNEGTCEVRFIVSKDGDVSEVQPITKKGTKLADVAVNAIKKGPMWIPGKQNGHNVNSFVTVPVTFKLSDGLIIKNEPQ